MVCDDFSQTALCGGGLGTRGSSAYLQAPGLGLGPLELRLEPVQLLLLALLLLLGLVPRLLLHAQRALSPLQLLTRLPRARGRLKRHLLEHRNSAPQ